MKLIGKFKEFKSFSEQVGIEFIPKENVIQVMRFIPKMLRYYLQIWFNPNVTATGELGGFSGKKYHVILKLLLDPSEKLVEVVSSMSGDIVGIDVKLDKQRGTPLNKVNPGFLRKIQATIRDISQQTGHQNMGARLKREYKPNFRLNESMTQISAEDFWDFLTGYAKDSGLIIQNSNIDVLGSYLKKCWRDGKCAICGDKMAKDSSVYPLCAKHQTEFLNNPTAFEKRHHL